MTSYAPTYARRPFKKVRADGSGLVPYGRSQLYIQKPYQRPIGARGTTKGVDTRVHTVSQITTNMSNNTNIYPLNLIQSGTGSWNRVGRLVTMKSVRLRLSVKLTIASVTVNNQARKLRYVIVYDKQPNGTLPVKGDIFQYKTQDGTETGDWNGFLSYDNMQRFTILKDETVELNPQAGRLVNSTGAAQDNYELEKFVDCYLKLNHSTTFKSETAPCTISDISTGALYLIYLTDVNDAGTAANSGTVTIDDGLARLRYYDQ